MNGAGTKNRTRDPLITSQLLYRLSYTGLKAAAWYQPQGGSGNVYVTLAMNYRR